MRHVAIVRCDQPLASRLASFRGAPFTFSARQRTWERKRTYLTFLISDSEQAGLIRWLGAIEVTQRTSDIDRNLEVFRVHELEPSLPLGSVVTQVQSQRERVSDGDGPLSDTMGPRLVEALLGLRPELAATIDGLVAPRHRRLPGAEGERLAMEKDAVGVILDSVFAEGRDMLRDWTPVAPGVPFLRGLPQRTVHEDDLIHHDASH